MPAQLSLDANDDHGWAALAGRLHTASHISILTGAGISAESGLPTFRASGLWETFRVEDVATPDAFARDPELVWRFYNYRRELVASAAPNDGHRALVALQSNFPDKFTLITQNVDGLHQQAGSSPVIELHGSIREVRCTKCGESSNSLTPLAELPKCACGGLFRPGVVWFGERLPEQALHSAERAINLGGVLLVIGTSAVVYPAAGLILEARDNGSYIIEVNPAKTDATYLANAVLRGPAAVMLPRLVGFLSAATSAK